MLTRLVAWMVLLARSETANQVEILVLHHQLAVLRRSRSPSSARWLVSLGSLASTASSSWSRC